MENHLKKTQFLALGAASVVVPAMLLVSAGTSHAAQMFYGNGLEVGWDTWGQGVGLTATVHNLEGEAIHCTYDAHATNAFVAPYHVDFDLDPGGWKSWPIPVIALGVNYVTDVKCKDRGGFPLGDFHHEGVF
jgi:hypothetical protein